MTIAELHDWYRFADQHPFPVDVIDLHGAMHIAALANIHRDPNGPPYKPADFLVLRRRDAEPEPEPPKLTEAQRMRAALKGGG
jgi:hypothetical protein